MPRPRFSTAASASSSTAEPPAEDNADAVLGEARLALDWELGAGWGLFLHGVARQDAAGSSGSRLLALSSSCSISSRPPAARRTGSPPLDGDSVRVELKLVF